MASVSLSLSVRGSVTVSVCSCVGVGLSAGVSVGNSVFVIPSAFVLAFSGSPWRLTLALGLALTFGVSVSDGSRVLVIA